MDKMCEASLPHVHTSPAETRYSTPICSAKVRMSGTSKSGCAGAGDVAPKPGWPGCDRGREALEFSFRRHKAESRPQALQHHAEHHPIDLIRSTLNLRL